MGDDWRYRELAKWIEANRGDLLFEDKTTFLANPDTIRQIDEIIKNHFWPAVRRGVKGTGIDVSDDALDYIETTNDKYVTRSTTFLLEDPRRPLTNRTDGGMPPWYCRGNIKSSLINYMISFDLFIYLPISFNIEKIIRLLGDERFSGLPPELKIGQFPQGKHCFDVSFHSGRGAGFGLENYEQAAQRIEKRVRANTAIVKRVDDLFNDVDSNDAFEELKGALLEEYEAF